MFEAFFTFPFLQQALLAGLVVGMVCPIVGVFLVVRRLSLIADTLAHVALSGVAAGLFLQKTVSALQGVSPVYVGMAFSVAGAFFVEHLRRIFRSYPDLSLPILLSAGTALAAVLISLADGFNGDVFGYLFGSLIAISRADLTIVLLVGAVVLATVVLLYKELFFLSFDEEGAAVAGIPRRAIHAVFVVFVAAVIGVAMNIVGLLLVSSLITLPVAAALQMARSFKQVFVYAVGFSELAVLGGLVLSYVLDLATGGVIVLLAAAILLLVLVAKRFGVVPHP
ncbi:metal ABC transporter permease [Calditerricola satsumensis]|uniref:Metal ABC transporter permease n=1 Tax=Calditerricola satsumensis TaxID=373054 RepID=A0A8J3FCA1_9BACI|nr:metal ABC transporter permease [Calditerricola satsumensis]GGK04908.1 metal ABC transporter permease [Calditerricola satsumensis]